MDLPPIPQAIFTQPSTQRFHLSFTFDPVTNATWYAVLVKTNGVEAFRRYSMTNYVIVSNLSPNLDQYTFTAIATNEIGYSDESLPAVKKLVTFQDGTNLTTVEPTNTINLLTNAHPIAVRQWNAQQSLKKD